LHTVNTFGFTYGKVEARARIPAGDWIWPGKNFSDFCFRMNELKWIVAAIWMMPRDSSYGGWPTSGEIDIMESRGNRDLGSAGGAGVNIGVEQVQER